MPPGHFQARSRCRAFSFSAAPRHDCRHGAIDDIIIADEAVIHPDDLHGELHPLVRPRRPERQQGRDRGAVALRRGRTRTGLSERVRERTIKLAGQRATKDGVIVIEAGRFRTQEQNRADARARLTALVAKAAEPPPPPRKKTRPTKGSVERRLKRKAGRGRRSRSCAAG